MNGNLMKDEEFRSLKLLKLKYRIRKQLIQQFCRIGFHQEIRSPLCNLGKFEKSEKIIPESCRMHWNLMSDEEFGSLKLLKLKYRRGDQIFQRFWRIWVVKTFKIEIQKGGTKYFSVSVELVSPRKLGPPSLICRNLKSLRKLLLDHA